VPAIKDVGTISAEKLRELLDYNPLTGEFKWRRQGKGRPWHRRAGSINNKGYWVIVISGRLYMAHRLAWLYVYGEWPAELIDHVKQDRRNTSIAALRQATHSQNRFNAKNNKNNTSSIPGVRFDTNTDSWCAQLFVDGSYKLNKHFASCDDAIAARMQAEAELFGEFVPDRIGALNKMRADALTRECPLADIF